MLRLVRFLTGYVRVEAQGGYPERFLNAAAAQDIPVWDASRQGISLFVSCPASAYRRLRPAARRSGVRMRVKKRRGLPFLLRPLRLRWGLAAGAVMALVLLQILSSRIWVITVTGNDAVTTGEILQVLEPLGIRQGASFSRVDIPRVQLTALQQMPELIWLTVNQKGSTVEVQVRERQPSLPVEDNAPANVVAKEDGVILKLDVTDGQAMVKEGDAVTKGTLLISGVTDSKVGPLLRRAAGSVTARITVTLTAEVPLRETVPSADPKTVTHPTIYLFGLEIPLYTKSKIDGDYTESTRDFPLEARGKALPIGWRVTTLTFCEEETVQRTMQEALELAREQLKKQETDALSDLMVESTKIQEDTDGERVMVTGTYVCVGEIGITEVIKTK